MPETVVSILARAKRPADALEPLVNTLAEALGIDPLMIAHYAKLLRRSDLLPAADGAVTPLHAARLLTAVMGSHRPIDAADVATIYEQLPALAAFPLFYIQAADGKSTKLPSGSFTSAVVDMIELAAEGPMPSGALPEQIMVSRDPNRPCATIVWMSVPSARLPGGVAKPTATVWTFVRVPRAPDDQVGMTVSATCPGRALQRLGDLFAEHAQADSDTTDAPTFAHLGTPLTSEATTIQPPPDGTFGADDPEAFANASPADPAAAAADKPTDGANVRRLHTNLRGPLGATRT
jgi:hypothetical protein